MKSATMMIVQEELLEYSHSIYLVLRPIIDLFRVMLSPSYPSDLSPTKLGLIFAGSLIAPPRGSGLRQDTSAQAGEQQVLIYIMEQYTAMFLQNPSKQYSITNRIITSCLRFSF